MPLAAATLAALLCGELWTGLASRSQCLETNGTVYLSVRIDSSDEEFCGDILERRLCETAAEAIEPDDRLRRSLVRQHLLVGRFFEQIESDAIVATNLQDAAVCIWQMDDAAFRKHIPDDNALRSTLLNPANFTNPDLRPLVVMEIAGERELAALKMEFANRAQSSFGFACAELLASGRIAAFSPAFAQDLSGELLHYASLAQLFQILDAVPGDPRVIAEIARRLHERGLDKASRWIATFGSLAFIDRSASYACRKLAGDLPMREWSASDVPSPSFEGTPLAVFGKWRHPIPGGSAFAPDASDASWTRGVELLAEKRHSEALTFFMESIARNISAPACRNAAECARLSGRSAEAAFLLEQALNAEKANGREQNR